MKYLIFIIIIAGLIPAVLNAQINWTEHPIDTMFDGAYSVYATDVNNDGDTDILGAAYIADDITWWENADDTGAIWIEYTIADNFDGAVSVYALDIDGDSDIDILGAAYQADDITWWENTDGAGTTWVEHTIADNFDGVHSVYATDIDGDSDIDVLGAAYLANDITWWENADDTGMTWIKHTIDGNFNGARAVYAVDIDGDSDIDVLGAAASANDITWWENADDIGMTWIEHTIADNFGGAISVYAADIDGDSDIDVFGAAYLANDITWWENDGNENFTEHTIADNFGGPYSVYAADIDGDTDIDVLGAAYQTDDITWWESDLAITDASVLSIDIPSTVHADTIVNPQATVANSSTNGETVTFDITCTIEPGGYTSTYTVTDLAADDSTDITFDSSFTFASGSYTITAYTQLEGDENPANDTLVLEVEAVNYYDVGTVSIDISSTVPEDTELNPHATITNGGVNTETFNVTCTIDPGVYTSTTVSNIAPGESIQVTFPDEVIFASGVYTVTVYTRLGTDENPANDTLEKIIETYDPGIAEGSSNIPLSFAFGLKSNPAKGKALFHLALPEAGAVTLTIYDISGRVVDNVLRGMESAGYYEIPWDSKMASGIYFYKLVSPWKNEVGKLVLVR